MDVTAGGAVYEYYADTDWEVAWIEEHRKHRVSPGAGSWLRCHTCNAVLHVTTRPMVDALRALQSTDGET